MPPPATSTAFGGSRLCVLVKGGPCRFGGGGGGGGSKDVVAAYPKAKAKVEPAGGTATATRVVARWRAYAATTNVSSIAKGLQTNDSSAGNELQIIQLPEQEVDDDDYIVIPEVNSRTTSSKTTTTDHQVHLHHASLIIDEVRAMLSSMGDGEISISAYDTAWVAMVPSLPSGDGNNKNSDDRPQFPAALRWIVGNQLADGSWGDATLFSAYDRMTNTLACVVALTRWGVEPDRCRRGLCFLEDNMWRLAEEDPESMPIGFEIAFPSLVETARRLGVVRFQYHHHALQGIYANRQVKLNRIPMDMMHQIPTSILHSLEGVPGVDWNKILRLQSSDGSFLYSPAATACALMQTGDRKCLEYIHRIVSKFDGGVPNVYPVDLFEHLWVVDRLERLGISRYFQREIDHCMDYVNRHWTEDGICWARNSNVKDVDDTAMAFRLLRMHGYNVSPSVFNNFEKDGEFFCFVGQSTQAITGMYNLHRASQVSFPGEDVLHRARSFSYQFLREREAQGTIRDKWTIAKDLPGEVQYTLDFPWYASLPRLEARTYLDQYGGDNDVWIGKTLYRMPLVNNNSYLELARHDFNSCQVQHQLEWHGLQKWFTENGLEAFGVGPEDVLRAYFLAAASIFEPNRSSERLAWARVSVLANIISAHFRNDSSGKRRMDQFMRTCLSGEKNGEVLSCVGGNAEDKILVTAFQQLIDLSAQEALPGHEQSEYIRDLLRHAWKEWMVQQITDIYINQNDRYSNTTASVMQHKSCMVHDKQTCLLLVKIIEISAGRIGEASSMTNRMDGGDWFSELTSIICDNLHRKMLLSQDTEKNQAVLSDIDKRIELNMQELAQKVVRPDERTSNKTKQTFLSVIRSCYYATHCPPYMVDRHVNKIIFERVI